MTTKEEIQKQIIEIDEKQRGLAKEIKTLQAKQNTLISELLERH